VKVGRERAQARLPYLVIGFNILVDIQTRTIIRSWKAYIISLAYLGVVSVETLMVSGSFIETEVYEILHGTVPTKEPIHQLRLIAPNFLCIASEKRVTSKFEKVLGLTPAFSRPNLFFYR
jgi:hypothetical protein